MKLNRLVPWLSRPITRIERALGDAIYVVRAMLFSAVAITATIVYLDRRGHAAPGLVWVDGKPVGSVYVPKAPPPGWTYPMPITAETLDRAPDTGGDILVESEADGRTRILVHRFQDIPKNLVLHNAVIVEVRP